MKLISYRKKLPQKYIEGNLVSLECKSVAEQWVIWSRISDWCKEQDNNSVVVWNYKQFENTFYLWFEEEQFKTWFELVK
jgi:hypothetical protein